MYLKKRDNALISLNNKLTDARKARSTFAHIDPRQKISSIKRRSRVGGRGTRVWFVSALPRSYPLSTSPFPRGSAHKLSVPTVPFNPDLDPGNPMAAHARALSLFI